MPVVNSPRAGPKNRAIINKQVCFYLQGLVRLFQLLEFAPYKYDKINMAASNGGNSIELIRCELHSRVSLWFQGEKPGG